MALLREVHEPAALARAAFPPLVARFHPELEALVERRALLTEVQRSSALRAWQALSRPPQAFFLGHGPGVGKTRVLAALARQQQLQEPAGAVLWLVPNAALRRQAGAEAALFELAPQGCRLLSYGQLRDDDDDDDALAPQRGALLILDEAHLVRNACATSARVQALQAGFERVVYSTATPASDVAKLSYMGRLQLWGAASCFQDFQAFSRAMRRWGPSAAEMLALDLKQRGLYVCHRLPPAPLRQLLVQPCPAARARFDGCCEAWGPRPSLQKLVFFQRLTTALKADALLPRWREDLAAGRAVVIVLQGTGAAACQDGSMLRRIAARHGLELPADLPDDALDLVRRGLWPEAAAELSGRPAAMRAAQGEDVRHGNARALAAFAAGERRVLLMTAAGTLGLNVVSPLPIQMYILEAPWTPEVLEQQLGRCNRLNGQPASCFLVSMKTFSEQRVETMLARRSETLGALTSADRGAASVQALPWGRRLIRRVTLEMTARLLARRLPAAAVRHAAELARQRPRHPPLLAEQPPPPPLRHSALLEGSEADLLGNLKTVLALEPGLADCMATPPLEGGCPSLPAEQRAAAKTAALALRRARLPAPVVDEILAFACGDDWPDVESCLRWLPPGALDEQHYGTLVASAVGMPLRLQQRLLLCCEQQAAACGSQPRRLMSVQEFCWGGRSAPPRGFSFEVRAAPAAAGRRLVRVAARDVLQPVAAPCLFALASGHLVHAEAGALQYAGRMPSAAEVASCRGWLSRNALARFRASEAQKARLRAQAAQGMSRALLLQVETPLQVWDKSGGQVLAVDADGERFVGLLMGSGPGVPG